MVAVFVSYVVPVVHVLACGFLILVVLLQTGKGADMGAVFGGGSQTLFGSSGAGNFLTKLTTGTAIAFMITSLILTYGAIQAPTSNLFEKLPPPVEERQAPAIPGAPLADGDQAAPEEPAVPPLGAEPTPPPAAQVPAPPAPATPPVGAPVEAK